MTVFMISAALVAPCLWALTGIGLSVHAVASDACDMMQHHVDGQLNPWVLDYAHCGDFQDAYDALQPAFAAANTRVNDANNRIARAPADAALCVTALNQLGVT